MKYEFIYNLKINDKNLSLRELSFIEYRNLVKNILTDDAKHLSDTFTKLVNNIMVEDHNLNVQERFLLLLKFRELIHGKLIEFSINDSKINYSLDFLYDFFINTKQTYKYNVHNNVLEFGIPKRFNVDNDVIANVASSLVSINGDTNFEISDIPAIPFIEIYNNLAQHYENYSYTIKYIDYKVSFFDASCLYFLKSIFLFDLQGMYDLEYALRKNLGFNVMDLNTLSFPECNMMLKMFNKEAAENEKAANKVDSVE